MSQGPIQIREPGGFEYTQFGIIDLGSRAPVPVGDPANGGAAPAAVHRVEEPQPAQAPIMSEAGRTSQLLTRAYAKHVEQAPLHDVKAGPREVVKAARARVRDIRRELKRLTSLKSELDELERLLAAAKQKPEAKLRALRAG